MLPNKHLRWNCFAWTKGRVIFLKILLYQPQRYRVYLLAWLGGSMKSRSGFGVWLLLTCLALFLTASPAGGAEHLFLFGGGPYPSKALDRYVALAGGHEAKLLVVTWASDRPPSSNRLLPLLAAYL